MLMNLASFTQLRPYYYIFPIDDIAVSQFLLGRNIQYFIFKVNNYTFIYLNPTRDTVELCFFYFSIYCSSQKLRNTHYNS